MKAWTAVFTDPRDVVAVAMVVELGDGVLNVVVTSKSGSKWEPGRWTADEAQDKASQWARQLVGRDVLESRWLETDVQL
jgi:hypothetical protein